MDNFSRDISQSENFSSNPAQDLIHVKPHQRQRAQHPRDGLRLVVMAEKFLLGVWLWGVRKTLIKLTWWK